MKLLCQTPTAREQEPSAEVHDINWSLDYSVGSKAKLELKLKQLGEWMI